MTFPEDLKYLRIVESALNPKGTSRVGAQGLWQFMPNTAPEFGMQVSIDVDERMDTNLATKGALSYLKKSYERYFSINRYQQKSNPIQSLNQGNITKGA